MTRLRLTLRGLLRAPAFSLASIGTLALAVCLSTAVFAVVDGVLFKPLPYPEADALHLLTGPPTDRGRGGLASADIRLLQRAIPNAPITAYGEGWILSDPIDPTIRLQALRVDRAFFDVLRQRPLAGGFEPDDFTQAALPLEIRPAIVSHAFWRARLGGDLGALGSTVQIPQQTIRVAGVLPEDFVFPHVDNTEIDLLFATPETWRAEENRWFRSWHALVRLAPGQSRSEAAARYDAAMAAALGDYGPPPRPSYVPYDRVVLEPIGDVLGSKERPFFGLALAGAAVLVLIACINVTGLLLARTAARARELRVRVALGASRREVASLVTGEVMLLTAIGAGAGLALSYPLLTLAATQLPEGVSLLRPLVVDWRVATFSLAAPLAVMLALSSVPVRRAFRAVPAGAVSSSTTPPARSWAASSLLAAESGIGIALLIVGTFVLASFATLRSESLGVRKDGLGIVDILVRAPQDTVEQRVELQDRVLARIAAVPGVDDAALVGSPMLDRYLSALMLEAPPHAPDAWVVEVPVSGGFFEMAGLTLEEGRLPTREEVEKGASVAVLSRPAARELWGEASALGRTVKASDRTYEVVGVVADVRLASQSEGRIGEAFTPLTHSKRYYFSFLYRSSVDMRAVSNRVRAALAADLDDVLVERAEPIDDSAARTVRVQRFQASLFGIAGGAAALLLAVGVAGIVASSVRRRWREAGIRAALGASGGRIVRMLVADHVRPAAFGIALGLLASWWIKEALRSLLYQLEPGDLRLWAIASALVVAVVIVAAWLPARRAASVDPALVLRAE